MRVLLEFLALLLFLRSPEVQCSDNAPSPTGAAHVGLIDLLQYTANEISAENSTQNDTQMTDNIFPSGSQEFEQNGEEKDVVRLKRTPHKKGILKGLMGMIGKGGGGGGGGGGCSTCGGYSVSIPVYVTVKKVQQPSCSTCGQYVPPPPRPPPPRPPPMPYCDPCNRRPAPPPPPRPCNTCGGGGGYGGNYAYASSSSTAYSYSGKKK